MLLDQRVSYIKLFVENEIYQVVYHGHLVDCKLVLTLVSYHGHSLLVDTNAGGLSCVSAELVLISCVFYASTLVLNRQK